MTAQANRHTRWAILPVSLRAVITGIGIALIPANVWPRLLSRLGVPLAVTIEVVFLGVYVGWASGGGPPERLHAARRVAFRSSLLSPAQWFWGVIGALFFAATVHAAIVLLFRFVPFPTTAFRRGYDFSFIPALPMKWVAVVVSATSAGLCEETGFRGYLQQPIEQRHGAPIAILVSSFFFMLLHLTKAWATVGRVPIVLGAGVLLGLLAWSSGSLIPGMIGHVVMDIGLFGYWWSGIAGAFSGRPISETGVDRPFLITCAVFAITVIIVLLAARRLRRIRVSTTAAV
jgi:membrane protease YdiL (CAAX protease family)